MDIILQSLFRLDVPWLEIIIRGSAMYLGVFTILRVILKREVGSVGIPDLLMVTMIADAAQNGMAGEYRTITSGLLLVLVLVFWNFVLDRLAFRFPWFEDLTHSRAICLVRNGRLHHGNLHRASITRSDLMEAIRKKGFERLADAKAIFREGDGEISVIEKSSH